LTYSQRGAVEYRELGYPPEKIFVAPNAVSPRPAHPAPQRLLHFNDKPCLLFVGRLQSRKRVDLLLRACAGLPEGIQPRLVVVGDGPERSSLEQLAGQIYPSAEFPGAIHGPDLIPYYLAADLFVLPGTGGLAVQQAMSQALPVIVAEGDGTQADLVRPTNGWQIPPGDLAALLKAIQIAISDLPRLRRKGLESYRIVSEEINLEGMVDVFVEVASRFSQPR
jgi:glycosyltransferase involved in cell wall biosynthesis